MKLDVTIEGGEIRIDVESFLSNLTPQQLRRLALQEAFRDSVIWGVVRLIASGDFFDDEEDGADYWRGRDFIAAVSRELAPVMPEHIRNAVMILHDRLRIAERKADAYRNACWDLRNAWRDAKIPDEVRISDYLSGPRMTEKEAEAEAFIRNVEAKVGDAGEGVT